MKRFIFLASLISSVVFFACITYLSTFKNPLIAQNQTEEKATSVPFPITYGQVCSNLLKASPQVKLTSVPEETEIQSLEELKASCVYIELKGIPSEFEIMRLNRLSNVCVVMTLPTDIEYHDLQRLKDIKTPCQLVEVPFIPTQHEVDFLGDYKGCVNFMLEEMPDQFAVDRIKSMARGCVNQQLNAPISDQDIKRINKLPCLFTQTNFIPSSHEAQILNQLATNRTPQNNSCAFFTNWRSGSMCIMNTPKESK